MHGRVKVKTSAQEKAEKRLELERKLKIYRTGYDTVCEKRKKGEYDEEILRITEQLLRGMPDVYTLWNVRRESLSAVSETRTPEEYEEILKEELKLIEAALRSNPKSYGAWHHRMWVMGAMKTPPVAHDLMLCGKLLSMDARNFHCWDYRRWLSQGLGSGNKNKTELDFSFAKLAENFSNYSAWHYRTIFLPSVCPNDSAPCSIDPAQHKKELDLVQDAVFTDPADQSAWFYLRWLLGKGGVSLPKLALGMLQCHGGNVKSAALVLSKAEKPGSLDGCGGLHAELRVGNDVIQGHWKCSGTLKQSHVWIFSPSEAENLKISLEPMQEGDISIALIQESKELDVLYLLKEDPVEDGEGFDEWVGKQNDKMELNWLEAGGNIGRGLPTSLLEEQLELCNQLLDLEPESKWTLLTAVQLMRTLRNRESGTKKVNDEKIMDYLDKLKKIDPLRSGFYSDLRSHCVLDAALDSDRVKSSFLDLSSLELTTLPSPTVLLPKPLLLATKIDLSGNANLSFPKVRCGALSCLSHLPRLLHLCLGTDFDELTPTPSLLGIVPHLPHLLCLELIPDSTETSLSIPEDVANALRDLLPALKTLKPL